MSDISGVFHRDRSRDLRNLGLLQVLWGLLLIGWAGYQAFLLGRGRLGSALPSTAFATAVDAAVCIVLGIGSLRARRWARTLWIASAPFQASDVLLVPALACWALTANPAAGGSAPPAKGILILRAIMLIFAAVPLLLFRFYRRPDVRQTCEERDSSVPWTDRCPWPVLAWCLYALHEAFGKFQVLLNASLSSPGLAEVLALDLGLLAFWLALGWGLYRLRPWAWWAALVALGVGAGLADMTAWRWGPPLRFYGLTEDWPPSMPGGWWRIYVMHYEPVFWLGWLVGMRRWFRPWPLGAWEAAGTVSSAS